MSWYGEFHEGRRSHKKRGASIGWPAPEGDRFGMATGVEPATSSLGRYESRLMEDIGNEGKLPIRNRFSARESIPKCPVVTPNDPENPERFRVVPRASADHTAGFRRSSSSVSRFLS
jgi:hypothetical protein